MSSSSSSSAAAPSRLHREFVTLMREPIPFISAAPLPHDVLDWRYVISGPADTPFEGGFFYGKLLFPADYPFRPPSIYMLTPNGRFKVNTRLCFSMSDFHPAHWNPAWTVSNILLGLLSFMLEETPTLGSIETSADVKRDLASKSRRFNVEKTDQWFSALFPEIYARCREGESEEGRRINGGSRQEGKTRKEGKSREEGRGCPKEGEITERKVGEERKIIAKLAESNDPEKGDAEAEDGGWGCRPSDAFLILLGLCLFAFLFYLLVTLSLSSIGR